jgi:hypothetical protein
MSAPQVPLSVVAPVLVIPDPARTANVWAFPRLTVGTASDAVATTASARTPTAAVASIALNEKVFLVVCAECDMHCPLDLQAFGPFKDNPISQNGAGQYSRAQFGGNKLETL